MELGKVDETAPPPARAGDRAGQSRLNCTDPGGPGDRAWKSSFHRPPEAGSLQNWALPEAMRF